MNELRHVQKPACVSLNSKHFWSHRKKWPLPLGKDNYHLNMTPAQINVDLVLCIAKLKWEADLLRLRVLVTQICILAQRFKFNKYWSNDACHYNSAWGCGFYRPHVFNRLPHVLVHLIKHNGLKHHIRPFGLWKTSRSLAEACHLHDAFSGLQRHKNKNTASFSRCELISISQIINRTEFYE